jgi:homoserine O-acetyltransferase
VLSSLTIPVLIIGFENDLLYPIGEQQELASLIPDATLATSDSPYGHDAFLIEFEFINQQLQEFYSKLPFKT